MSTLFVIEKWCPKRERFVPTGNARTTHAAAMALLKFLGGDKRQVAKYVRVDMPKKRGAK